jgi:hypothetical protein
MHRFFLLYAFINKQFLLPTKKTINERININYKLDPTQLNIIRNNLGNKYSILSNEHNEYMLTLNLYSSIINNTQKYNSYLSILVKDEYLNTKGQYILEHIEPIKYININVTNKCYYMYSNMSLICLYFNYTNKQLINIVDNIQFIYDNTTNTIIYNTIIESVNTYILNTNHLSNLKYLNYNYYSATNIIYSTNNYNILYSYN